ncbi:hypothetical protein HAZT_HAZT010711 [Hyalella azteca]|uniref:non-specific serine/threonine protein kinase n=1 Tax=Hyalella azteca TaxID=294128 RepID=A0A6A0GT32_HYAAZ|nr:hypothetical protein HAZT_HAZT010711 [Hyalella azteca]
MDRRRMYMLLMEYYRYGDLTEIFAGWNKSLSISNARCIVRQISGALEYMHDKRIAHRDLKLENILVAGKIDEEHPHLSVRVADFGLSSIDIQASFSRPGTRYTMAPEMLASRNPYDPYPADVWAVGVIGFCLMNANYPFAHGVTPR